MTRPFEYVTTSVIVRTTRHFLPHRRPSCARATCTDATPWTRAITPCSIRFCVCNLILLRKISVVFIAVTWFVLTDGRGPYLQRRRGAPSRLRIYEHCFKMRPKFQTSSTLNYALYYFIPRGSRLALLRSIGHALCAPNMLSRRAMHTCYWRGWRVNGK